MTNLTAKQIDKLNYMNPTTKDAKLGTVVGALQSTLTGTLITDITGDITIASSKVSTIGANKVNYAKLDQTSRTGKLQMRHAVAEATAATDFSKVIGEAPTAGTVVGAKFIPDAGFGAATDYATLSVINKGSNGAGSTVVATYAFDNTTTHAATAFIAVPLTLGTGAALTVAAGDVLVLAKTHGGNGQLVPVGECQVSIERTA
jgi:hypothetical protein